MIYKSCGSRAIFNYSSQSRLSFGCHFVSLVKNDYPKHVILLSLSVGSFITAANSFTLSRTILIPLSSDAFNSRVSLCQDSPSNSFARQRAVVVLPTPAGPAKSRCGISSGFLKNCLVH